MRRILIASLLLSPVLFVAPADLDASVVSAVRQFKFAPATLDNQAISMDINLIVDVQK